MFVSRFATFKIGVLNYILSALGYPVDQFNAIKKETLADLFQENCFEMSENIYHSELNAILYPKKLEH